MAETLAHPTGVDFLHVAPLGHTMVRNEYDDTTVLPLPRDMTGLYGVDIKTIDDAVAEAEWAAYEAAEILSRAIWVYWEDQFTIGRALRAALIMAYPATAFNVFGLDAYGNGYQPLGVFLSIEQAWSAASAYSDAWVPLGRGWLDDEAADEDGAGDGAAS